MKSLASRLLQLCLAAGFVVFISTDDAAAQRRSGETINRSVGLGAYMQFGHIDLIIPVWVSPKLAIVPVVGATNTENVGTDIGVGLVIRIYQKIARVSPYFGVRGHAEVMMPSGGGGSTTDVEGGVLFGGEFFLNNQFSFGIEAHAAVLIPDTGNRVITTATMFLANIYF